jgi:hypothetical protein
MPCTIYKGNSGSLSMTDIAFSRWFADRSKIASGCFSVCVTNSLVYQRGIPIHYAISHFKRFADRLAKSDPLSDPKMHPFRIGFAYRFELVVSIVTNRVLDSSYSRLSLETQVFIDL